MLGTGVTLLTRQAVLALTELTVSWESQTITMQRKSYDITAQEFMTK